MRLLRQSLKTKLTYWKLPKLTMAAQNQNIQDHFAVNHNNDHQNNTGLWIFGYGSLCWQPGFEYTNSITGYIRGYSRKFWQGNTTHRGTVSKVNNICSFLVYL